MRLAAAACLALCACVAAAMAQEELPTDRLLRNLQPTADVNDFAGILSRPSPTPSKPAVKSSVKKPATARRRYAQIARRWPDRRFRRQALQAMGHRPEGPEERHPLARLIGDRKAESKSAMAWNQFCPTPWPVGFSMNSSFQHSSSSAMPTASPPPRTGLSESSKRTSPRGPTCAAAAMPARAVSSSRSFCFPSLSPSAHSSLVSVLALASAVCRCSRYCLRGFPS